MNLKTNNQAYLNYLQNVGNDEKYLKEVNLKLPFPSKSFSTYDEEEFEELLKNNFEFNNKWGVC